MKNKITFKDGFMAGLGFIVAESVATILGLGCAFVALYILYLICG